MAYHYTQSSVPGAVTRVTWNRAPGPDDNDNPNQGRAASTRAPQQPLTHLGAGHNEEQALVNALLAAARLQYEAQHGYDVAPPASRFNSGHMQYNAPNYPATVHGMATRGMNPGTANLAVGHGRNNTFHAPSSEDDMAYTRVPANTPTAETVTPVLNSGHESSPLDQQSSATSFSTDGSFHDDIYRNDGTMGRRFPAPQTNAFRRQEALPFSPIPYGGTPYRDSFNPYQSMTAIGIYNGDRTAIMGTPVGNRVSGQPPIAPPPGFMTAGAGMNMKRGSQGSQVFQDSRIGQIGQVQNGQNALVPASAFRTVGTQPALPRSTTAPTVLNPAMPSSSVNPGSGNNHGGRAPGPSNPVAAPIVNHVSRFMNTHHMARSPNTVGRHQSFLPSNAVLRSAGYDPTQHNAHELAVIKIQHGISPNYQGDPTIARNHSANIPQSENCSFWIVNLPPRVTTHELLSEIRNIGRIFACVINAPQPQRGHCTAAAKVVFFDLWAAQRFYATYTRSRLVVGGYRCRVNLNRIRSAEAEGPGNRTRVVVLKGDPAFVNEASLTAWFEERFKFEVDEVITHVLNEHMGHVEYRFGSWRCQAETARVAIIRELGYDSQNPKPECPVWEMKFGLDPCAPHPTSALL
ncbi:hypothetical protein SODALDRAFT_401612 [Sodiomyces alkalinus F11]|uniref:RRM domain-containing protein n=1 Tax=Sodiomyces alkalinus (strain CBS 110278 / VKM F-3762 / F11) TaxID=1314773 RepID=A0A3N2PQE3_SODAK|nr:hypothetical protein SODALDRAFT_401612 [Sodiomyces alkalinus F11]ROT36741.1 hypothetical protein SODALDRAFT_401612 [Sodiomyces alkalinus F11]